ncbi:MAG TPA: hypothetical protein DCF90_00220, partial [Acinetobacter radioresistens]|nr:hypothetical protein [Acinetobacter radioresistens]
MWRILCKSTFTDTGNLLARHWGHFEAEKEIRGCLMAKRIFDADRLRQQFSEANSLHKQANQSIKFDKDARRIAEQQDKTWPVFL